MKEKIFKILDICKKIFFYVYAIFLGICFFITFIVEILVILEECYYMISNGFYDYIMLFTIIMCIIYFNYYLYCVGKHMYNIINNENTIFKDYFMIFSVIPIYFGVCIILFIITFSGR